MDLWPYHLVELTKLVIWSANGSLTTLLGAEIPKYTHDCATLFMAWCAPPKKIFGPKKIHHATERAKLALWSENMRVVALLPAEIEWLRPWEPFWLNWVIDTPHGMKTQPVHMYTAKILCRIVSEPQISISFAQQKLTEVPNQGYSRSVHQVWPSYGSH